MNKEIESPILLIGFNRPETFKIVLDSIRKVKPKKLYIAIDGPRLNKAGEVEACNQVADIARNIEWICDTKYLIREKNLGCKLAVTSAISWALENEEQVIIIEDDILAVPAFFYFADYMLVKYKHDQRIAMVTADNYTPLLNKKEDYLFSKYGHIWGWATWKRVWDKFDVNIPYMQNSIEGGLSELNFINNDEKKYLVKYFNSWCQMIKNNSDNAWGPQFWFFRSYHKLLAIVPKVNLASNIGTTSSRTGSVSIVNEYFYPSIESFEVQNEPNEVLVDMEYDIEHFYKHIGYIKPLFFRGIDKLKRIISSI
jgi:hypothetical protein